MSTRSVRLFMFDVAIVCALATLLLVAWLVPERLWSRIAHWAAAAPWLNRSRKLAHIRCALEELDCHSIRQIGRENGANWILRQLQLLKSYRPGGWQPSISIEGRERIDHALRDGKGVILWTADFRFKDLVVKMGMHRAGYSLTQLSMPDHGWSETRFGMRWLNPIWVRVEDRYLARRVIIDPADPKPATEVIKRLLIGNHIVSIAAVRGAARRPATIRICDAHVRLGLGAPILSYETGATLLPVFTLRQPDGSFRIIIEKPITIRTDRPRIEAAMDAVQDFGRRLERYIRAVPGQWNWWHMEVRSGQAHEGKAYSTQDFPHAG